MDPEELLLFTVELGDTDARLREECLDWCIRFGDVLSVDRLKALLKGRTEEARSRFAAFAGIVQACKGPKLPGAKAVRTKFRPSGKSERPNLLGPNALALRLRAVMGVGAKAEVLTRMLCDRHCIFGTTDFVERGVAYSRPSIHAALDDLEAAGLVEIDRSRRNFRYTLARRPGALEALDIQVGFRPRWDLLFAVLLRGAEFLEKPATRPPGVRQLDLREFEDAIQAPVNELGLPSALPRLEESLGELAFALLTKKLPDVSAGEKGRIAWLGRVSKDLAEGRYPARQSSGFPTREYLKLVDELHRIRKELSRERGYERSLGSDDALAAIATLKPRNKEELRRVAAAEKCLGDRAVRAYLQVLAKHRPEPADRPKQ